MLMKLFSVFFLYFLTLTFMVLYGTINVYGLGYGSQDTMNFNFFFKCLDEFFSTQSALYGCFKSFLSNVVFLHGHLYGCQVTINSIYGLDMVAKKGLWWSTLVMYFLSKSRLIGMLFLFCFFLFFISSACCIRNKA